MQKYEKILHFDEHYKKMQGNNWFGMIMCLFCCVLVYVASYYGIDCIGDGIPDREAWRNSTECFHIAGIYLTKVDVVYFIGGLLLMGYGTVRLSFISRENHSVREKDADIPDTLLTDGFYAKTRHPMYGTFIMMYVSIFLSLHSLDGLVLVGVITGGQYLNAYMEEKKRLCPLFGEQYECYKQKVKRMVLTKGQIIVGAVIVVVTVIGLI